MVFIAGVSFVLAGQVRQGRTLTATLPGGIAKLNLNAEKEQVCYELSTAKAGTVTIESGGSVVVSLPTPCTSVEREKIQAILSDPSAYYIALNGAVHGQFAK